MMPSYWRMREELGEDPADHDPTYEEGVTMTRRQHALEVAHETVDDALAASDVEYLRDVAAAALEPSNDIETRLDAVRELMAFFENRDLTEWLAGLHAATRVGERYDDE